MRHRAALKARIHATLIAHGLSCPVADLFGARGRQLLERRDLPEPWRATTEASLRLIADLGREIAACATELRVLDADHAYVPLLMNVPGSASCARLHDRRRDRRDRALRLAQEARRLQRPLPQGLPVGASDRRGPLARNGPEHLRWALIEAAVHAARNPADVAHYEKTKRRLGRQRGATVARIEIARRLAEAIWYMLTRSQAFAPAGPALPLVAETTLV